MKKWNTPRVTTINETELKNIIIAGACSIYCVFTGFYRTPVK